MNVSSAIQEKPLKSKKSAGLAKLIRALEEAAEAEIETNAEK